MFPNHKFELVYSHDIYVFISIYSVAFAVVKYNTNVVGISYFCEEQRELQNKIKILFQHFCSNFIIESHGALSFSAQLELRSGIRSSELESVK